MDISVKERLLEALQALIASEVPIVNCLDPWVCCLHAGEQLKLHVDDRSSE